MRAALTHSLLNYRLREINDVVASHSLLLMARLQRGMVFTLEHEKLLHCNFGCKPQGLAVFILYRVMCIIVSLNVRSRFNVWQVCKFKYVTISPY